MSSIHYETTSGGAGEPRGRKVLLLNIEMSSAEMRLVAERLRLPLDQFVVLPKGGLASNVIVADFGTPCAIVLDSVSALCGKDKDAAIVVAKKLKAYGARHGVPAFMIAHLTKAEEVAGLYALQHEVDTCVMVERPDKGGSLHTLTATKNRHGATGKRFRLEMGAHGLAASLPSDGVT